MVLLRTMAQEGYFEARKCSAPLYSSFAGCLIWLKARLILYPLRELVFGISPPT